MVELLEKEGFEVKTFKPGQLVEGTIISKGREEVLVDVGAKSEGIISRGEFEESERSIDDLVVGEKILATVVQSENDQGYLVLSLKKAEREKQWRDVYEAFEEGQILRCKILEYNKGGLLCVVEGGLKGFIPTSHLDSGHFATEDSSVAYQSSADLATRLQPLIGQTLKAKIIEVNQSQNRLVLSEKDAQYEAIQKRATKFLKEVKVGDILEGRVSGVLPFGIFVDVGGGVEGLVHISEISWDKVSYPGRLFSLGDKVKVKVIEVSQDQRRLSLSVKALTPNPWEKVVEKYPVGKVIKGKVSKVMPFGAFVTLEPGLDGLIHVSETVGPLEEGEEVEAQVIMVDERRQRLGLSIRQLGSSRTSSDARGRGEEFGRRQDSVKKSTRALKKTPVSNPNSI